MKEINPEVVFPMHYKTEKIDLPISGPDKFLENFSSDEIKQLDKSEVEIQRFPEQINIYEIFYKY